MSISGGDTSATSQWHDRQISELASVPCQRILRLNYRHEGRHSYNHIVCWNVIQITTKHQNIQTLRLCDILSLTAAVMMLASFANLA